MKTIKKIFLLLLFVPMLSFCLFACGENSTSVELKKENIDDYLVISQTAGDITDLGDTYSCSITISISPKCNNLTFKNAVVKISISYPSPSTVSGVKEIKLDSYGNGKTSFLITSNYISSIVSATYQISSASGTVIIGG